MPVVLNVWPLSLALYQRCCMHIVSETPRAAQTAFGSTRLQTISFGVLKYFLAPHLCPLCVPGSSSQDDRANCAEEEVILVTLRSEQQKPCRRYRRTKSWERHPSGPHNALLVLSATAIASAAKMGVSYLGSITSPWVPGSFQQSYCLLSFADSTLSG